MLISIDRTSTFLTKKPWLVFVFFTCLVIFLRWASFYQSVISWDESLYLLVAKAWSEGNPPYTAIWDNKPPGIYAIFLLAISLLGHSALSIRILACLFIATTCFFLYKIGGLIKPNGRGVGLLAGSLYAVLTLSNGGLASNTEVFYPTFVAIAAYIVFSVSLKLQELPSNYYLKIGLIGFLLGIGCQIKQVVLFDFVAFALILTAVLILQIESSRRYWLILKTLLILCLGFILPFGIVLAYYWLNGHFGDYAYANFTANQRRTVNLKFSFEPIRRAIAYQIKTNALFWLALPSTALYLLITKAKPLQEKLLVLSFIVWFTVILLGICAVFRGYLYVHYFLQLLPPLCLITAYLLISLVFPNSERNKSLKRRRYLILSGLLVALLLTTATVETLKLNASYVYFSHIKGIKHWSDTPMQIADYLKPKVKSDDYIYVAEYVPIVYFLVNAKIPTRYAFPSFLLVRPDMPNITGINPLDELEQILQKRPVYIIRPQSFRDLTEFDENRNFINKLDQTLHQNYQKETSINEFDLYKLSSNA